MDQQQQVVNDIKTSQPFQWLKTLIDKLDRRAIIDIIVILMGASLLYILLAGTKTPPEIKDAAKENKVIEKKIDSINITNVILQTKIDSLNQSQLAYNDLINKNNIIINQQTQALTNIKKLYNEKINSINGYSTNQLDSFFTNRYRTR